MPVLLKEYQEEGSFSTSLSKSLFHHSGSFLHLLCNKVMFLFFFSLDVYLRIHLLVMSQVKQISYRGYSHTFTLQHETFQLFLRNMLTKLRKGDFLLNLLLKKSTCISRVCVHNRRHDHITSDSLYFFTAVSFLKSILCCS